MKPEWIFVTLAILLVLTGCREPEAPKVGELAVTPETLLETAIQEHGEVMFCGWNGMEHHDGAHLRLLFRKGQTIKLDVLGNNFVFASGTYKITEGSLVAVSFENIDAPPMDRVGYTKDWPLLRLRQEQGDLLIDREDGKTNWHLDWPLYPHIVNNVWPARTLKPEAESVDAGKRD